MKCQECGASDRMDAPEGIHLECEMCGMFPADCQCRQEVGYTPKRWVHCLSCDRHYIGLIDTSKSGWRGGVV